MYARGSLRTEEAALLSSVCLVPLDKGGGKIRPIALGEVLAKLAQATLLDTIEKDMRRTLEPHSQSGHREELNSLHAPYACGPLLRAAAFSSSWT